MRYLLPTFVFSSALILTLQGSRSDSAHYNQELESRYQKLRTLVGSGNCAEAIPAYRNLEREAARLGFENYRVRILSDLSGCEFLSYHFHSALALMSEGREAAKRIGATRGLAAIDNNLAALFVQMGNQDQAFEVASEAVKYAGALDLGNRALLYGQLAMILAAQKGLDPAEPVFQKAIDLANAGHSVYSAAWAWDERAYARLEAGRLAEAGQAAAQSLKLRELPGVGGIDIALMILGKARALQGNVTEALALLNRAEQIALTKNGVTPLWQIYMRRGQIKLASGDLRAAVRDLDQALTFAREWRADVPGNDVNRRSSENQLSELYGSLSEAGNRLYLETLEPHLIRKSFDAAEENRAGSLRALLPQGSQWRQRLPDSYYELLASSRKLQLAQLRGEDHSIPLQKIRSQMSSIEASVNSTSPWKGMPDQGSASERAQAALDQDSALLSFQLGDGGSWLWAVTKRQIRLYKIASRAAITAQVAAFERLVSKDDPRADAAGRGLFQSLFGALDQDVLSRRRWILDPDGVLFNLPFAALQGPGGQFLIEDHSLQLTPGASIMRQAENLTERESGFLGMSDPVYNLADSRAATSGMPWSGILQRVNFRHEASFARLWGTAKEVEMAAHAWQAGPRMILTGRDANPANFWKYASNRPQIIHIASHILEENEKPKTGWIALSLDRAGQLQYITPEDILASSVPVKLVVLSGCSSGMADIQPATGLMGLTRAWLAAGAQAVLATRWPTVDDDGAFFESFYRFLKISDDQGPGEALRSASIEMLRGGTWRTKKSFWAGYFVVGSY